MHTERAHESYFAPECSTVVNLYPRTVQQKKDFAKIITSLLTQLPRGRERETEKTMILFVFKRVSMHTYH